jgi:pimeloyl-ACP methyl ester carboxylesterase
MVSRTACLTAFLTAVATPLSAQVRQSIDSHGSAITITSWKPGSEPLASLLLVPGWGGGPTDVLGTARFLSENGVEAFVLSPRGWHDSEGEASFANTLEDIEAALGWARRHATHEVVLGGHSFGGGMSMAYAARDPSVRKIISIAGTDHGELIRQYEHDPAFASMVDEGLASTAAPDGPIRFDADSIRKELMDGQAVFGLRENADALTDRSILMFGGWEDVNTTVDDYMLPLYRALRAAGAKDVTFQVFHTDHGFGNVRDELHRWILDWLLR